ncbi:MAG TPA: RNA-binding S4 domain-containing protein [Metalysinibacillus jejuensis]|uniref:RQC P-site tRNA stabilizing factor n=1 Tax=Metalysinibacillus jejuensis TaxID=914327 RepID=A0A921NAQ2_9BACL|nr:RNA-binding S4 domain-containing protein [Metalysinibacillus jejuensis]HJH10108.1 RNA-binding S4 domain-containing protein [Metalysinibacillus jejuensis]
MRLDKYLKVSRLIKRRTLAKEVATQGRITINGKVAKPGTVVKEGDELQIRFGQKIVTARVERLQASAKRDEASQMFTILSEERLTQVEPEFIDDEDEMN